MIKILIVDVGNLFVFVKVVDIGLKGVEFLYEYMDK